MMNDDSLITAATPEQLALLARLQAVLLHSPAVLTAPSWQLSRPIFLARKTY
jgi:hypothetical protein